MLTGSGGRALLDPGTLAAGAERLRAAVEGAVAVGLARPGDALADAYSDLRAAQRAALIEAPRFATSDSSEPALEI
jgi:hypothetical protein